MRTIRLTEEQYARLTAILDYAAEIGITGNLAEGWEHPAEPGSAEWDALAEDWWTLTEETLAVITDAPRHEG